MKKYLLDNSINYEEDRFLALGSSAFQSGFFIYIPRNLMIEEPIRIVYSLKDDCTSSICRNIVIADEGSKGTIVQELYSSSYIFTQTNLKYQRQKINLKEMMQTMIDKKAILKFLNVSLNQLRNLSSLLCNL